MIFLKTATGDDLVVDEGESCDVTAVPKDLNGDAISKVNLATLTVTLWDRSTGTIINSRDAQSVLDANDGTVATDGTLTLRLDPDDAIIVGDVEPGSVETHVLRLTWTWNDGVKTRTGRQDWGLKVRGVEPSA